MWVSCRRVLVVGLPLMLLAGMPVTAQNGDPEAAKLKNPVASTPESIGSGQKVYQRYCRGCHGSTGNGGPKGEAGPAPSDLTDATWDHGSSAGEIFTVIKNGIGPDYFMEAWGDRINDNDIWSVVNYLNSLKK